MWKCQNNIEVASWNGTAELSQTFFNATATKNYFRCLGFLWIYRTLKQPVPLTWARFIMSTPFKHRKSFNIFMTGPFYQRHFLVKQTVNTKLYWVVLLSFDFCFGTNSMLDDWLLSEMGHNITDFCAGVFLSTDPCLNYHCKKGKVCEVDESNTPMCVCQDPSTCPEVEGDFEHVSSQWAWHMPEIQ